MKQYQLFSIGNGLNARIGIRDVDSDGLLEYVQDVELISGGFAGTENTGWKNRLIGSNITLMSETTALIARMTVQPDVITKLKINKRIAALKAAGIWAKLDVLYFFDVHTKQASLLNWIKSAHDATIVGDITFSKGFGIGGPINSYLDTNYNPASQAVNFAKDSMSMGAYIGGVPTAGYAFGSFVTPNQLAFMATSSLYATNSSGYTSIAANTLPGMYSIIRTSSTKHRFVFNKNTGIEATVSSTSIPNATIFIKGINSGGSLGTNTSFKNPFQCFYAGSALSQQETDALYDALNISPVINACCIGDSTSAAYLGFNSVTDYMPYTYTALAYPGETIAQQRVRFDALSSTVQLSFSFVTIMIGLNDVTTYAESLASVLSRYQGLVDDIRSKTSASCKIILATMTPAKQRFIDLNGAVNGALAQQRWIDINSAIRGTSNAITGTDGYIDSHTTALDDGNSNLAATYDYGDHIHENNAARKIIGDAFATKMFTFV